MGLSGNRGARRAPCAPPAHSPWPPPSASPPSRPPANGFHPDPPPGRCRPGTRPPSRLSRRPSPCHPGLAAALIPLATAASVFRAGFPIRGAWFLMPVMHAWSDVMRLSPIRPDGTLGRRRGQRACRPLTYDDMPAVGARSDRRFRMRAPASRASPVPAWLAHTGIRAAHPYARKLLFNPLWIDWVPELLSRGATQVLTAADTGPSGATDFWRQSANQRQPLIAQRNHRPLFSAGRRRSGGVGRCGG
ncbi:hypothetical protein SAMN05446589_1565 [Streptomyces sp. OV198]|nr:hypothetical protein SAMN05446589_1565 [Streptomyces sp. OV198]